MPSNQSTCPEFEDGIQRAGEASAQFLALQVRTTTTGTARRLLYQTHEAVHALH
jgi:hypothetical protein